MHYLNPLTAVNTKNWDIGDKLQQTDNIKFSSWKYLVKQCPWSEIVIWFELMSSITFSVCVRMCVCVCVYTCVCVCEWVYEVKRKVHWKVV